MNKNNLTREGFRVGTLLRQTESLCFHIILVDHRSHSELICGRVNIQFVDSDDIRGCGDTLNCFPVVARILDKEVDESEICDSMGPGQGDAAGSPVHHGKIRQLARLWK